MARILGIDYGERRMGLALSDEEGIVAMPLRVVEVTGDAQAAKAVQQVCRETVPPPAEIVIGLPLHMSGEKGPMAEKVARFAEQLQARTGIPVRTWDERLSSSMVERVLLDADMSRSRRKEVRDKLAAQVILQGYLDSRPPPKGSES